MKVFNGIDELADAAGCSLGYSEWIPITQARIDAFAAATDDHQWIHVDTDRAAKGPFGTTIAHGYLTLALVPRMLDELFRIAGPSMQINYGADRLRFPSVVPVGSKVRGGVELLSVRETAGGHQFSVRVTVEREGGDKPVCVVDLLALLMP